MNAVLRFSVVGALVVLGAGWLLSLIYSGADDRRALLVSGIVAVVVQVVAFTIVRLAAAKNVIAGWGAGAILRFAVFVVYALFLVKPLALPMSAATVSLAVFLFLSTLMEPLFLNS